MSCSTRFLKHRLYCTVAWRGVLWQVSHAEAEWQAWYYRAAPETEPLPGDYDRWTSAFEHLLMVRCWRPDRALLDARNYIGERLAGLYVLAEPPM